MNCVITGASGGIGRATASKLAQLGATLGLVCRNPDRGQATIDEIRQKTRNANIHLFLADLSIQDEVTRVSDEIRDKYDRIDALINNAGVAVRKRTLTRDGIEMTFAVNHLAYFLLTNLLIDRLKASAPARIVNVSSEAHRQHRTIDFENLQGEKRYSAFGAYALSKLCNILFTYELANRLQGTGVTANAMHPGFLSTGIFRESGLLRVLVPLVAGRPEKGADAIVRLVTAPELETVTGRYFRGTKETSSSETSNDKAAASRLWKLSAALTKFTDEQ